MNRESRRHPTHPLLPLPLVSEKRIPDQKEGGVDTKKHSRKKYKRKQ